jgi:hypothetical protein
VIGQIRPGAGIIGGLYLPGYQSVFDIDFPAAPAGTVDAVSGANDLVALPAAPITILPTPVLLGDHAEVTGKRILVFLKEGQSI